MCASRGMDRGQFLDRIASAFLGAVFDSLLWIFVPLFVSLYFPLEKLEITLIIGGLIVFLGFIAKFLKGRFIGSIFGAMSDSLKIFFILGLSDWGMYSLEYEGYRIFVDARLVVALLVVPFLLSIVDRFLSIRGYYTNS